VVSKKTDGFVGFDEKNQKLYGEKESQKRGSGVDFKLVVGRVKTETRTNWSKTINKKKRQKNVKGNRGWERTTRQKKMTQQKGTGLNGIKKRERKAEGGLWEGERPRR